MTVFVGTAGFSYNDWKGHFYPENIQPREMLETYARQFCVVEINSTYYAIPDPERLDGMAHRTPVDFQFTVKANQEMTHGGGKGEPPFRQFREAVRPLLDHGRLGCVLAQFPWGFKHTEANRRYLERLARELDGIDTVVEFRNSEWETDHTYTLLERLGLGYVCVDEPRLKGLLAPAARVTGNVGYVRFHGRSADTWWDKGRQSWERYDYLYNEKELSEWVPRVQQLEDQADRVYVIFNNHYKGQAPTNARMFEEMLRGVLGEALCQRESEEGPPGPDVGKLF